MPEECRKLRDEYLRAYDEAVANGSMPCEHGMARPLWQDSERFDSISAAGWAFFMASEEEVGVVN